MAGDAVPPVIVRSTSAGRVLAIRVAVGDTVEAGAVLLTVSGDAGALSRKLDALRREEREFAAAAHNDPAAKADLEAIRAELRKLENKLMPRSVNAPTRGVVVEVMAQEGALVRDGVPVMSIRSTP